MSAPLTQSRYRVDGMDCASCATKIATAAKRLPGIASASVSVATGTMTISHGGESDLALLRAGSRGYKLARLAAAGAAAAPAASDFSERCDHEHGHHHRHDHAADCCSHDHGHGSHDLAHGGHEPAHGLRAHPHPPAAASDAGGLVGEAAVGRSAAAPAWWRSRKALPMLASAAALAAAFVIGKLVPAAESAAFAVAMLIGLLPIARRAVMAGLADTPFSIESLMTVAAFGALAIGAAEEGATVVFLLPLPSRRAARRLRGRQGATASRPCGAHPADGAARDGKRRKRGADRGLADWRRDPGAPGRAHRRGWRRHRG